MQKHILRIFSFLTGLFDFLIFTLSFKLKK